LRSYESWRQSTAQNGWNLRIRNIGRRISGNQRRIEAYLLCKVRQRSSFIHQSTGRVGSCEQTRERVAGTGRGFEPHLSLQSYGGDWCLRAELGVRFPTPPFIPMFTFPKGWDKVEVDVPLGHQDGLRIGRRRAKRDVFKWVAAKCPENQLKPDLVYHAHIMHRSDPGVAPCYENTKKMGRRRGNVVQREQDGGEEV